jgi:tetratricopeptide (TPR) repeat protein
MNFSQAHIRSAPTLDAGRIIAHFSLLLALGLTLWAPPAFPEAPRTRREAVAGLSSPDPALRAEAIAWIAERGAMDDTPLLRRRLRDPSPLVRGIAEEALWRVWSRSGDPALDALMARGAAEMQAGRLAAAIATYSEVIRRKPAFAEGWNRRATAYYLAEEFDKSIADCGEVLKRNPAHFGALSGLGQIYAALERDEEALDWFRRALEVNPNMAGVQAEIRGLERRLEARRRRSI